MNLKTLSQILSRSFILKATSGLSAVESTLRFRGVYTPTNIKLIEDVPAIQQLSKDIEVETTPLHSEAMQPVLSVVGSDPFKLMLAFCIINHGRWMSTSIAWKNFINSVTRLDNKRLNNPERYNRIQFDYVLVMMGWLFDMTRPIPSTEVRQVMKQYMNGGPNAKQSCWMDLNKQAGYIVEQREQHLYSKDELFNALWEDLSLKIN